MADQIVIERRFRGPPDSGHGGYACAMVARYIDGPAEVTLRSPPPLEQPLTVEREAAGAVRQRNGGQLVAEGRPVQPEIDVPAPPSAERAQAAGEGSPLRRAHPFSTCFVCGSDRAPGDGLRVISGPLDGKQLVAFIARSDTVGNHRRSGGPDQQESE